MQLSVSAAEAKNERTENWCQIFAPIFDKREIKEEKRIRTWATILKSLCFWRTANFNLVLRNRNARCATSPAGAENQGGCWMVRGSVEMHVSLPSQWVISCFRHKSCSAENTWTCLGFLHLERKLSSCKFGMKPISPSITNAARNQQHLSHLIHNLQIVSGNLIQHRLYSVEEKREKKILCSWFQLERQI